MNLRVTVERVPSPNIYAITAVHELTDEAMRKSRDGRIGHFAGL